jgi:hypothetical protein
METLIYLSQHLNLSTPLFLELYLEDDFNLVFLVNDEIHAEDTLTLKERLLVIRTALDMFEDLKSIAIAEGIEYLEVGSPYDLIHRSIWEFDHNSARKFDFYVKHLGFNENGILFLDTL